MHDEQFGRDRDAFLAHIRGFAASSVIFALLAEDVFSSFGDGCSSDDLARKHGFEPRLCEALVTYLAIEGLLESAGGDGAGNRYRLTSLGEQVETFAGWFNLMIGGYREVFANLVTVLRDGPQDRLRNLGLVGLGSCQISRFDALPLAQALILEVNPAAMTLLDVGCGDASFLCDLCEFLPSSSAVGVETSDASLTAAKANLRMRHMEDRVQLVLSDALAYQPTTRPDFILFSFVLQEIVGQSGESALIHYLGGLRRSIPASRLLVIEVDHRPGDVITLGTPIGLGYYNPYYLLHPLTGQQLLPTRRWDYLFGEAGYRVVARKIVDPTVDPSGLEFGVVLESV